VVRIIRQPYGAVDGVSLGYYRPGRIYDVTPLIADFLVLRGFAVIEMRRADRSRRPRPSDRRKL
jgi:hypothetical protein